MTVRNRTPRQRQAMMPISEVAERLGISAETARVWCRAGKVPGARFLGKFEGRKGEVWRVERVIFERSFPNLANLADLADLPIDR